MRRKEISPITDIGIQTVAHEGHDFSYEQEGTGIISDTYREFATPVELKFGDIPTLIGPSFEAKLEAIANEQAKQLSDFVYARIDETIEQGGTRVDAQNKPLSKELWLNLLERIELSFDEAGKPELTFVAHPAMVEEMVKRWQEWEKDPEFRAKYQELLTKKREAFLDRESNRKLVD